jgi:hypothetical protein
MGDEQGAPSALHEQVEGREIRLAEAGRHDDQPVPVPVRPRQLPRQMEAKMITCSIARVSSGCSRRETLAHPDPGRESLRTRPAPRSSAAQSAHAGW